MAKKVIKIKGKLLDTSKQPIASLRIEAWDKDLIFDDFVAEAVSDKEGVFEIKFTQKRFKELFFDNTPDLYFKVYASEKLIHTTYKTVLWNIGKDQSDVEIIIDVETKSFIGGPRALLCRIFGVVRNEFGQPLENVTIQVFNQDLRSGQMLGNTIAKKGQYEVAYEKDQFFETEEEPVNILVKVLDEAGIELHKTPIFYQAPDELEVNINIKGVDYKGPSEWDNLTNTLTPLLEGLAPMELREDDQFQDVSFLSGESGRSQLIIGTWITAHHLSDKTMREKTNLDAAVFFGFMRQGQPALLYDTLLQDIQHPDRVELLKDKILRGLSAISPELQKQLLQKALAENLIPATIVTNVDSILERLREIKVRYAAENTFGAGKGTIAQLLQLTPESAKEQTKFVGALIDHTGPIRDFWKKLEKDKILEPEMIREVKLNFELGALTRNHIPLVAALNQQFKNQEITAKRDLAKLDRQGWVKIFQRQGLDGKPVGVPSNIDGDTEEKKYEQFGAILEESLERSYPTTAFMARLRKNDQSAVAVKSDVVRFLDNNPHFHLDRYRIDHYLTENSDALKNVEDKEATLKQLKSIQRVFKLNPTHKAVDALLSRNLQSAQQIYFMGKEQFVATLKDTGINKIESKRLYHKAQNAYALALNYFGNYNLRLNGLVPSAVPDVPNTLAEAAAGGNAAGTISVADLPNLQTLFGSLDYCECTHCRSVYSPAAHFVDILRFLGERSANGKGINLGKNVKQVVFQRRPDLGEIELSCENTNTPLPYIDLVNEILEDVVSPLVPVSLNSVIEPDLTDGIIKPTVINELAAKGIPVATDADVYAKDSRGQWAIRDKQYSYKLFKTGASLQIQLTRQTHLSAAELRANPEYTNPKAYDELALGVFPFNLPFDLWYLQSRAYLTHLGVPQARLFELFQQKAADNITLLPGNLQIDGAWIGIAETERKIITRSLAGKQPWDFWGLAENANNLPHPDTPADTTANVTGTWINVLSHVSIMLHRTGLNYKELLQLFDTQYINPAGTVIINDNADSNAANCDTTRFRIIGLTQVVLERMHRFLRLWHRLGCAMWELDMLLPDTNPAPNIIDKQITDIVLQDISRMNRIRQKFGWEWREVLALYNNIDHSTYSDRSKSDAPVIQTLYQRLFRNKLVDATAVFPESPEQISGPIEGDPGLAIPVPDKIPVILAAYRINEEELNLILADSALVAASPLDWAVLSQIYRNTLLAKGLGVSVDQFLRLKKLSGADPFADPGSTLTFIELAEKILVSGFTIPELDYLLTHHFKAADGVAPDDKFIIATIKDIRAGLQKVTDDIMLKSEETAEAYIKSKLGLLPALIKDGDQSKAMAIINGTWADTPNENRNTLIDQYFLGVLDLVVAKVNFAPVPPGGTGMMVENRFLYFQPALQNYLLQSHKERFIRQKIAEVFQLEVPTAELLLALLKISGSLNTLRQHLDNAGILQKKPDGSYLFDVNEISFPDSFTSLRLLHKNALVINKLPIKADELNWWLTGTHAVDLNWPHPKDFPTDSAASVPLVKWINVADFFSWKNTLPKSELTAFEFMDGVLNAGITAVENMATLAKLTATEEADVIELISAFRWDVKQEFKKSSVFIRLGENMQALRRLGVSAARAISWAKAEPGFVDAESLKQAIKAKYDLAQWQQVIQPLQDIFREQKRNALVSWLVSRSNPGWMDTNALYSYFLIDVEMSACMLTSRLKQAAASAQLFVQRCLMNLEADISVRAEKTDASDTQADSKWKQWKWMKYYRVWEANRKVFLYPENWIEPELRDEKSPYFKDLENELLQNDISRDTAEQAYLNYLEKLDKVANLEVRTIYNETISSDESVLHVFGRTRSSVAPEYFYRKRINRGRWTAWEKVDLEIAGNHLVAAIHNRRLHLFWPQFIEKAVEPTSATIPSSAAGTPVNTSPTRYWEIRLFWSELKKGKWLPKVLSDTFEIIGHSETGGNNPQNISLRVRLKPFIQVRLYNHPSPSNTALLGYKDRLFNKIGKQLSDATDTYLEHLISAPNSYLNNGLLRHSAAASYFYYSVIEEPNKDHTFQAAHNAESIQLLGAAMPNSYSVIDSAAAAFSLSGSFFFWDLIRTYFVDYTINRQWEYNSTSHQWEPIDSRAFGFFIHYHPFVELFIRELNIWGIRGLLNRRIQVSPQTIPASPSVFDFANYLPTFNVVKTYELPDKTLSYPVEDVDFSYKGAYALYNWELFFHVPFHIANKLAGNQRFEEALEWFHYIFNPTNTDNAVIDPNTPQQKYWITKPFYETTKADYYKQKIENLLLAIAKGEAGVTDQVKEWRDNPFNPHLIARMRTVSYQKSVLIKYIQTIIAWGDQLFRRNTIETINEATQLYILADSVLGPYPKSIPKKPANPLKTFYQLEQEGIDVFGNALMEVENLLPRVSSEGTMGEESAELPRLDVLYFCIPNNEKLLTLWDTVADRLFKIRHCMNIEGNVQQLPLFDPPIDPGALVRATAGGLDISSALAEMNAPLPLYRFSFMIQRALEMCNEVKSLGAAVLSALEKKDADGFALLRSTHEIAMMDSVKELRNKQIDEALRTWEALTEGKKITEERKNYYEKLLKDGWNTGEILSFSLTTGAIVAEVVATVLNAVGTGTSLIPEVTAGAAGFGGSPTVNVQLGGRSITSGLTKAAEVSKGIAGILQIGAAMSSTAASYARRAEEWDFQKRLAEKELPQIDKQIAAADIRKQMTTIELRNHQQQKENSEKELGYMLSKFTNQDLYDWMINQVSTVYFQSYQLAFDIAKRAERCFRYELGLSDSSYIQFGYWDSLKKGLLSGEKLFYDLKRLEAAYYEQNRREFELIKHISLSQLDPIALLKLRQNGECIVDVPETVFDMDYPGHYFRRLKSVSLSIPCIAGPYATVACTLSLLSNKLRKDPILLGGKYERDTTIDDPRFRDEIAAFQSMATSNAQQDSGMFELNFRDERYLPFEGAGAISTWHIKLNKDFPQFDLSTISDVIIHLNYTAREGGGLLRAEAVKEFNKKMNTIALAENKKGLFRIYDVKREFSTQWHKFLHPPAPAGEQELVLENLQERLPYFTRPFNIKKVSKIEVVALAKDTAKTYKVLVSPLGNADADLLSLGAGIVYQGLHNVLKDLAGAEVDLNTWTIRIKEEGVADFKSLSADAIGELFLIINYTIN